MVDVFWVFLLLKVESKTSAEMLHGSLGYRGGVRGFRKKQVATSSPYFPVYRLEACNMSYDIENVLLISISMGLLNVSYNDSVFVYIIICQMVSIHNL